MFSSCSGTNTQFRAIRTNERVAEDASAVAGHTLCFSGVVTVNTATLLHMDFNSHASPLQFYLDLGGTLNDT